MSAEHRSPARRICFVTDDFAGVIRNGGIGTHFLLMSRLLAQRGWGVDVLFCGPVDNEEAMTTTPGRLAEEGISFTWLDATPAPAWHGLPHFGDGMGTLVTSQHAFEVLEALHAERAFDIIEFSDWRALGFRAVQAKRSGIAFADTRLAVKLHSPTEWQRRGNLLNRRSPWELKVEYCERYAFEHADLQLSPSRYMLADTREQGWDVRDDAVVAYPFPHRHRKERPPRAAEVAELVFFGRLERRKGLDLFFAALDTLPADLPVLFLGRDSEIDGRKATDIISERMAGRPHRIESGLDRDGAMSRLRDERAGREVLPPGTRAGVLQLHPDLPNRWDAWDIDAHYRRTVAEPGAAASIRLVEDSPLRATIEVTHEFGRSRAVQRISLSADSPRVEVDIEVDWQERETVLKAAFPLDVLAPHHSAEIQFGHVRRPTHTNTSWDTARFEVCAHRWVHVGEDGYGVALVNDSTYGHDITRGHTPDGQPFTLVRLSLLRAPQYPDPTADLGTHRLRYAVVPGATVADAISHGYAVNLPLRLAAPAAPLAEKAVPERARSRVGGPAGPFVVVDGEGVYIEAVKLAHDRSGDVIVRLYEGLGGHRPATVTPSFTFAGVLETDLLEQPLVPPTAVVSAAPLVLRLRPFQIVSLRFREPRGPVPGRPGAQPDA